MVDAVVAEEADMREDSEFFRHVECDTRLETDVPEKNGLGVFVDAFCLGVTEAETDTTVYEKIYEIVAGAVICPACVRLYNSDIGTQTLIVFVLIAKSNAGSPFVIEVVAYLGKDGELCLVGIKFSVKTESTTHISLCRSTERRENCNRSQNKLLHFDKIYWIISVLKYIVNSIWNTIKAKGFYNSNCSIILKTMS